MHCKPVILKSSQSMTSSLFLPWAAHRYFPGVAGSGPFAIRYHPRMVLEAAQMFTLVKTSSGTSAGVGVTKNVYHS